jgi:hypothetical protein
MADGQTRPMKRVALLWLGSTAIGSCGTAPEHDSLAPVPNSGVRPAPDPGPTRTPVEARALVNSHRRNDGRARRRSRPSPRACSTCRDARTAGVQMTSGSSVSKARTGNGNVPVEVPDLRASAITVGAVHVCALRVDGEVLCWGDDTIWQLGPAPVDHSARPVPVPGVTGAVSIAAGYGHTCAALPSGVVRCWGSNRSGQLGGGPHGTFNAVPADVLGLTDAIAPKPSAGAATWSPTRSACLRRSSQSSAPPR